MTAILASAFDECQDGSGNVSTAEERQEMGGEEQEEGQRRGGHLVLGIDPARPSYGSPTTLEEATIHLAKGKLGKYMKFLLETDPATLTRDTLKAAVGTDWEQRVTAATLVHCSWYFSGPQTLKDLFDKAAELGAEYLFFAEYGITPRGLADTPHLLAALAQQQLEASIPKSESNIRCVIGQESAKKLATEAGWEIMRTTEITSPELDDCQWEVSSVLHPSFEDKARKTLGSAPRQLQSVLTLIEATRGALQRCKALGIPLECLSTYAFVAKRGTMQSCGV